ALLSMNQLGKDKFEMIVPSISILAEPPVAVVDKIVDFRKTRAAAEAYVQYLYSDEGQKIAAKHYFRPRNQAALTAAGATFPKVNLFTIDQVFGGWQKA